MRYLPILYGLLTLPVFAQQPASALAGISSAPNNTKVRKYIALSRTFAQAQPDSAFYYANVGIKLAEQLNDTQKRGGAVSTAGTY